MYNDLLNNSIWMSSKYHIELYFPSPNLILCKLLQPQKMKTIFPSSLKSNI